jgi:DnaK suppressor protein
MSSELTEAQLKELHADLLRLEQELIATRADSSRRETVDLELPIGRLSRVDALQQQAMAEAEHRRAGRRLDAVQAAISFHEEGDYGFCKECGEDMPWGRLKARPETPLCVPCLSVRELT